MFNRTSRTHLCTRLGDIQSVSSEHFQNVAGAPLRDCNRESVGNARQDRTCQQYRYHDFGKSKQLSVTSKLTR